MGEETQLGASIEELTSDVGAMRETRQEREAWLDDPKSKMRSYAHSVAAEHDMEIDWVAFSMRVSQRTRRHGAVIVEESVFSDPFSNRSSSTTSVELDVSVNLLKNHGVDTFKHAVRHELIHIWQYQQLGEIGHGPSFERWADRLDVAKLADCRADGR